MDTPLEINENGFYEMCKTDKKYLGRPKLFCNNIFFLTFSGFGNSSRKRRSFIDTPSVDGNQYDEEEQILLNILGLISQMEKNQADEDEKSSGEIRHNECEFFHKLCQIPIIKGNEIIMLLWRSR